MFIKSSLQGWLHRIWWMSLEKSMENLFLWGFRYYTIYDLANKRIGLALARQPVGQAGYIFWWKKTPGGSVSKRNGCPGPGGIFTCQRGCSPSRIIVVRWGNLKWHDLSPLKYVENWSGEMGIGWELLDLRCIKTTERPFESFDQSGAEFATSIGA